MLTQPRGLASPTSMSPDQGGLQVSPGPITLLPSISSEQATADSSPDGLSVPMNQMHWPQAVAKKPVSSSFSLC